MGKTVHDRYQVGDDNGLDVPAEQTFDEALQHAVALARRTRCAAWVWDAMAHIGQRQEWEITPEGRATVVGYKGQEHQRPAGDDDGQT